MAVFLLVILATLVTVGTSNDENTNAVATEKNSTYDVTKEVCCKGNLYPKESNSACCGSKVINSKNEICCNNQVLPRPQGDELYIDCCRNQTYNTQTEICCEYFGEARVHKKEDGKLQVCCELKAYDIDKQQCCSINYGLEHLVVDLINENDTKACQRSVCGIESTSLGDGQECCSRASYQTSTHMCCDNTIVAKGDTTECCGQKAYDTQTEVCCQTPFFGKYAVKKQNENDNECCGNKTYDNRKQICCSRKNNLVLVKQGSKDNMCCGDETTYALNKEICCGKKVLKGEDSKSTACCGEQFYNTTTNLCCKLTTDGKRNYNVLKKEDDRTKCCGLQTYKLDSQICCNKKLFPKDENTACCDKQCGCN